MDGFGSKLAAGTLAAVLLMAGCSGDDDSGPAATEDPSETSTSAPDPSPTSETTIAPEPEVVEEPVAGFDERTVVYGNVEYNATRAVVTNQDLRSYAEGTEAEVEPGVRYLVVEVTATNLLGSTQVGLDDDEVGLIADDTRLPVEQGFLTDITGFVPAAATVDGFLAFAVDDAVDPAGATLVFGAPPDRVASMPLTGTVPDSGYPVRTEVSGEATGVGPTNGGTLVFRLQEALVAIDLPHERVTSPTGQRADEGEVFLRLHVRVEKTEGRGNDLLDDGFRLLVDGDPVAPFDVAQDERGSDGSATAEPGAVVDAWVLFVAPTDASELALQVGAFDQDPGVIPLDVALGT